MYALPNYDPETRCITDDPVQVTVGVGEAHTSCTCLVFSMMLSLGGEAARCVHTVFVGQHLEALQRLTPHAPGETVPIRTMVQEQSAGHAAAYYWVDGVFVRCYQGRLKCSSAMHGRTCAHIEAVALYRDATEGPMQYVPAGGSNLQNSSNDSEDEGGGLAGSGGPSGAAVVVGDKDEVPANTSVTELRRRGAGSPAHPCSQSDGAAMRRLSEAGPPTELKPRLPLGMCSCQMPHPYSVEGYVQVNPSCTVYLWPPRRSVTRPLYLLNCPNNHQGCRVEYDGLAEGLYRYSSDCVVASRMLHEYLDFIVDDGMTVAAFVAYAKRQYAPPYADASIAGGPFMSETQFRKVFYSFLYRLRRQQEQQQQQLQPEQPPQHQHLQEGTPEAYCFTCPVCKEQPRVLIGDATSCTIQAKHYTGQPITAVDSSLEAVCRIAQQARNQRCFCSAPLSQDKRRRCMRLLARLAEHVARGGGAAGGRDSEGDGGSEPVDGSRQDAEPSAWSASDIVELEELASAYGSGSFVTAAIEAGNSGGVLRSSDRKVLAQLLASLATESPVLSYLPRQAALSLTAALAAASPAIGPADWAVLESWAPLVAGSIAALGGGRGKEIPTALAGLLSELCKRSVQCCEGPGVHSSTRADQASCLSDECLVSGVCCGLPEVRSRPQYAADAAGSRGDGARPDCNHAFNGGAGKTGGIFTWFCEHGVCYAVYIIPKAEGRNEAFSFLTCYFEKAPEVVMYDFSCALQEYCLNRAPEFFKDTLFVIDRFHWWGHKSCAKSYNPSLFARLHHVNTSIAEQCNAALARIKSSITRMSQVPFMLVVRFYLDAWNRKKITTLNIYSNAGLQLS